MKKVSYEEYTKELENAKRLLLERTCVKDVKDTIWFTNRSWHGEPINLFVNFACLGAVEPLVASRYADCIKEAAKIAKNFKYNGYVIGE